MLLHVFTTNVAFLMTLTRGKGRLGRGVFQLVQGTIIALVGSVTFGRVFESLVL